MSKGYSSDQFYNLDSEIGFTDGSTNFNRNEKFMWPGPIETHVGKSGLFKKKKVERGFIKMLTTTFANGPDFSGLEWANKQCFFQFNPQTIRRNVQMREDMMHPLLQDPGQFAVPVPGNATFAFDLMFDRSFELNRGRESAGSDSGNDILAGKAPDEIGVLHDMRILDGIVGQGISEELIDYIAYRGQFIYQSDSNNPNNQVATTDTTGVSATGASATTATGDPYDIEKIKSNLGQNVGNQAFLIPNPVRIVFSSLFMVDGFINNMDVAYVKFTENMVPSQVVLSISMQAVYIGFARKDTFLTHSLANADPAVVTPPAPAPPAPVPNNGGRGGEQFYPDGTLVPPTIPSTATGDKKAYLANLSKHLRDFIWIPKNACFWDTNTTGQWLTGYNDFATAFDEDHTDPRSPHHIVERRTKVSDSDEGWNYSDFPNTTSPSYPSYYLENADYPSGHRYSWAMDTDVFNDVKKGGRAHYPAIAGTKWLDVKMGFKGIPNFGNIEKDPIAIAFASGATISLTKITYQFRMRCIRPGVPGEAGYSTGEDSTDRTVELFKFFDSKTINNEKEWKQFGQIRNWSSYNITLARADALKDQHAGTRLYIDTDLDSTPSTPAGWKYPASRFFNETSAEAQMVVDVAVQLFVGSEIYSLKATQTRKLILDNAVYAVVRLAPVQGPTFP
jgi:hypothetical protein